MKANVAAVLKSSDTGYTGTHVTQDTHVSQEIQESHDLKILRYRELKDTHDTHDSASESCVETIQQAVDISLVAGINETCLFVFGRALRAFEVKTNCRLDEASQGSAFALWWATAKLLLPDGEEYAVWESEFLEAFRKVRVPFGMNAIGQAIRDSENLPWPEVCNRYAKPIGRVVAVCYHLQRVSVESSFFLSVRDTQRIGGFRTVFTANAILQTLIRDGVLEEVEKGALKGRKASRYKLTEKFKG